jgi:hypothetical protein
MICRPFIVTPKRRLNKSQEYLRSINPVDIEQVAHHQPTMLLIA